LFDFYLATPPPVITAAARLPLTGAAARAASSRRRRRQRQRLQRPRSPRQRAARGPRPPAVARRPGRRLRRTAGGGQAIGSRPAAAPELQLFLAGAIYVETCVSVSFILFVFKFFFLIVKFIIISFCFADELYCVSLVLCYNKNHLGDAMIERGTSAAMRLQTMPLDGTGCPSSSSSSIELECRRRWRPSHRTEFTDDWRFSGLLLGAGLFRVVPITF